jgi:RNA polymerase sigma factor for flagellar operon FliA
MNAYASVAAHPYPAQEDLVAAHVPLVKRIACHLAARLPASTAIEDLMQAGMLGLLEAAASYDPARGASFETWAGIRIRGAMLDEVRRLDWTPRSVRRKVREVSEAMRAVEARTGRAAEGREVAAELGISIDEYHAILRDAAGSRLFSLEEATEQGEDPGQGGLASEDGPDQSFARAQFARRLAEAIARLPERERLVLSLYYERDLNLKEIGAVLDVTESRVCQIHGQALVRLRAMLER